MQIERTAIETHYWNYYANASVGDEELVFLRKLGYGSSARYERRKIVAARASFTHHEATADTSPPADRVRVTFDTVRIKKDGTEGTHFRNDYFTHEQKWETEGGAARWGEIVAELRAVVLVAYLQREQIGDSDAE